MRNWTTRATLFLVLISLLVWGQELRRQVAMAAAASPTISAVPVASAVPSTSPSPLASSTPSPSASVSALALPAHDLRGCSLQLGAAQKASSLGSCRVLVIGDSLGNNLAGGLRAQLGYNKALKVTIKSRASTGLANSWFYNWPRQLPEMLTATRPHLVVVMLGANDRQDMRVGNGVAEFGSAAWNAQYERYVRQLTRMSTDAGAYVLWVGLPIMEPRRYNAGMAVLNQRFAAALGSNPEARFLPTWDFFADSAGKYRSVAPVNGRRQQIRGGDGIHFSLVGQNVLATYVLQQMNQLFAVDLKPRAGKYITG